MRDPECPGSLKVLLRGVMNPTDNATLFINSDQASAGRDQVFNFGNEVFIQFYRAIPNSDGVLEFCGGEWSP